MAYVPMEILFMSLTLQLKPLTHTANQTNGKVLKKMGTLYCKHGIHYQQRHYKAVKKNFPTVEH